MLECWVDEVADMELKDGSLVGDSFIGQKVLDCARENIKQEALPHVPCNLHIRRPQDMGKGYLELFKEEDGDMCLLIRDEDGNSASIQFCTGVVGGGRSPRTLNALYALAQAMVEDNRERPVAPKDYQC